MDWLQIEIDSNGFQADSNRLNISIGAIPSQRLR